MSLLQSNYISCPYCGELIELLIDCSIAEQNYIEDCFVCCRPIQIDVVINNEGHAHVVARDENEA